MRGELSQRTHFMTPAKSHSGNAMLRMPLLAAVLLTSAITLSAADAAAAPLSAPSLGMSLIRMTGALTLVFAVFLGGLWLFRNWQRLAVHKGQAPRLNILEVKSLGHRHALYVVGYEQQRMLLAASPNGVTMLTALTPEAAQANATAADPIVVPQRQFTDALHEALNRNP